MDLSTIHVDQGGQQFLILNFSNAQTDADYACMFRLCAFVCGSLHACDQEKEIERKNYAKDALKVPDHLCPEPTLLQGPEVFVDN